MNLNETIPFLDLQKVNEPYFKDFMKNIGFFLNSGNYINGDFVRKFEQKYAEYCGSKFCIGTGNGLDALKLILLAYKELKKVKDTDEVIVPANTYIATILSIIQSGLKPVLVEPRLKNYTIDPVEVEKKISKRTKVIVVTHLYGQLGAMKEINSIADKHDIIVISDAAQAQGAENDLGLKAGNLCNAAAFSFYPTKNLGALGDAGCVTTNDEELAILINRLKNYGTSSKYVNDYKGYNSRLDEIQASFLIEKLSNLDSSNKRRRLIAKRYMSEIFNPRVILPYWNESKDHVFHLYVMRVNERKGFCEFLEKNKIGYMVHYPIPPHKQRAFSEFNHISLPITEKIHNEVVSIPLNTTLTDEQVTRVINVVNEY